MKSLSRAEGLITYCNKGNNFLLKICIARVPSNTCCSNSGQIYAYEATYDSSSLLLSTSLTCVHNFYSFVALRNLCNFVELVLS